jgi:hypothetical protein
LWLGGWKIKRFMQLTCSSANKVALGSKLLVMHVAPHQHHLSLMT